MRGERWSDSAGSYIRIRGEEEDRISDRILQRHGIRGICPMEMEHIDGHREYIFDISGFRSFAEVMEESPLSREQWLSLLEQLAELVCEVESYLLEGEHLVIREDMLWLRGTKPELGAIYIPEHRERLGDALGALAEKSLHFPEHDREASEVIYRLHAECMGGVMTVRSLREFLKKERGEEPEYEEPQESETGRIPGRDVKKSAGRVLEVIKKVQRDKTGEKEHEDSTGEKTRRGRGERISQGRTGEKILRGRAGKRTSLRLPLLLLAAGIGIPVLLLWLGFFTSATTAQIDYTSLAAAFLFFGAAGGYGAWRLWPSSTKDTVWEDEEEPVVCLIPEQRGCGPLAVEHFPWKLGCDDRQCDALITEEGVSPLHACIRTEGRAVLLVDQESAGGTYHNESRLVPWTPVQLKDGDRITFGRTGYVVEITEG